MPSERAESLILTSEKLKQKVKRIAYEIRERNFRGPEIALVGIAAEGHVFACMLQAELEILEQKPVTCLKLVLNKHAESMPPIKLSAAYEVLEGKTIIITDDVLNTGRTLLYASAAFLNLKLYKIQTAVIIDRSHRSFPIAADYTGHVLSTTLNEHVDVRTGPDGSLSVYLVE